MATVRPVERVVVVSRTPESAEQLADRARRAGLEAVSGQPGAIADADIVCTCTTARVPLFDSSLLPAWAHVNAIGSHEPTAREVDAALVGAAQIAVETRAAALAEAGDLLIPLRKGDIGEGALRWDLAEVVSGQGPAPDPGSVSLYKSVGIAYEDLVVASEVVRRYKAGDR
jgi:ornithine cyclodeaminase